VLLHDGVFNKYIDKLAGVSRGQDLFPFLH